MTVQAAFLFAALHALAGPWYPPGTEPETAEERERRVRTIAIALDLETRQIPGAWPYRRAELALAVGVKLWHESGRFSLEAHAGEARGDGGRSICLGQIMRGPWLRRDLGPDWRARWSELAGTDLESTRACVRLAVVFLVRHERRCWLDAGRPVRRAFDEDIVATLYTAYATGYSCDPETWPESRRRTALFFRQWERFAPLLDSEVDSDHAGD